MAVVLFHAGVPGVTGGLLGVDVFFVLSGFLITALLCDEERLDATIRLAKFWGRRARRLLPGLFILLLGVAAYAWVFRQSVDVGSIRGDALATLFFVANWHFVFAHQGYFAESVAPSPLLNMWSLGVEEQYYLVWPLVALLVLRRWGSRRLVWVAGVGAAASSVLTICLYHAGFSTDVLYYGTDTRAQTLLVGSALGALASQRSWSVVPSGWAQTRRGRVLGTLLGVGGAGALLWFWHVVNGQTAFLYDGGFLLVALAAGAVLTVVTSWRTSILASFLSLRPIVYIGLISYGVYLYHWPLFLVLDHTHTSLSGVELFSVRLAVTFAVAIASFHLVEQPIRKGSLSRAWRGITLGACCGAVTAGVLLVATTAPASSSSVVVTKSGLGAVERRDLSVAHAFGPDPVKLMMVGDSVAWTASRGLSRDAHERYGIELINKGILGCDLSFEPSILGGVRYTPSRSVNCGSWRQVWAGDVAEYHPNVVGVLIGRFELADHLWHGNWVHVGEKGWDRHLEGEMDDAVRILSAGGASIALCTFPYIDPPLAQPDGAPWPENLPSRVNAWNAILHQVAAAYPRKVTLIHLHRMLDPGGHFVAFIDGIRVRWKDTNIHITIAGGEWLQPRILPEMAELGLEARAHEQSLR